MQAVLFALAGALCAGSPAAVTGTPEEALVPGRRVEHQLAPSGGRTHTLHLEAGQFVRLSVVQEGLDLAVTLVAPDGGRTEVDVASGLYDREPLSLLAATRGVHGVELRRKDRAAAGRYAIESDGPRPATADDRVRVDAERALAEAVALVAQGGPESGTAARGRFEAALGGWRALDDKEWEAETLLQRTAARLGWEEFAQGREDAQAALALVRRLADRRREARALHWIGESHDHQHDLDAAISAYEQARELRHALGDRADEAYSLSRLQWAYGARGEHRKGVEMALTVREMRRRLGDPIEEGWALMALGETQGMAGAHQDTIESWREARAIFRAAGDRTSEGLAIQRLASVYGTLGDAENAAAASEEALAVFRVDKHVDGQITACITLGGAYLALGKADKALEAYAEALRIVRETGQRSREARSLSRLGSALTVLRRYEEAERHLNEALRLAAERKDVATESEALLNLGELRLQTGQVDQARGSFQRAAEVSRASAAAGRESKALYHLARIARDDGDLDGARARAEAALGLIEGVRRRLTSPALRSTYVASAREAYELYVDVLMGLHRSRPGLGFDERALEAAEMSRARGLLDQISHAELRLPAGLDPALVEQERDIQGRLSAALDRQLRLTQARATEEQAQSASRTIQLLTAEWDAVRARIKARSPRFAELRDPVPYTAAQIRQDVLDEDTVLLQYALGEKRSFLWVVSRQALVPYDLPGRADVEKAAREAYAQLNEPARIGATSSPDALARLSRMILGPAAASLTTKRLLVVADGALHYVPFAALTDPNGAGDPLVVRHEVVGAPSASVLALLRREAAGRRAPPKTLAVLADPVFDGRDARVRAPGAGRPALPAPGGGTLASALRSAGVDGGLPRLPFTRREAEAILSLVPARERLQALDFDASRATVSAPSLADYRLVHFATHGFLNSAQPELSGIVLSLVSRDGGDAPGFLTPTDVFNLHLNADMVVLSGCRTALGRELRGEGLVGLSRAFMYAGAPRVVASLWRVDDAASAELMKRFYGRLLKDKLPAAAALRAAQLDLMRRPRFRDPFYWSAFQLQGEWR